MGDFELGNEGMNLLADHQEPIPTTSLVPDNRLSLSNLEKITADQVRTWSDAEQKSYKQQILDLSEALFNKFYRLSKLSSETWIEAIICEFDLIRNNVKAIDEGMNLGGNCFRDFPEKLGFAVDDKSSASCMSVTIRYHNNDIFKLLMKDLTGIDPSTTGTGHDDYKDFDLDIKHYRWFFRALIDAIQVENELGMVDKKFFSNI